MPDEASYAYGEPLFWGMIAAGLFVPLYALYKALDSYFEKVDKTAAEADEAELTLRRDLKLLCQQTVASVADDCDGVEATDLAAQVWLCRDDDTFDRFVRFYLPEERKGSGIDWKKGKGIAGMAWQTGEDLSVRLGPLRSKLTKLGPTKFNKLPPSERFGMSANETRASDPYVGIFAFRLFAQEAPRDLLAMFIVDYSGKATHYSEVLAALSSQTVSTYLGGCERILTASIETIQESS